MKSTIRRYALLCAVLAPVLASAGDPPAQGQRPFRPPPQEAVQACAKLELNATCRFTFDGRAHEGACRRGPEGQGPVACAPDHAREQQERGPGGEGGPGAAQKR